MKCAMVSGHDFDCSLCNGLNCIHYELRSSHNVLALISLIREIFWGDQARENSDHTPPSPSSQLPTGKSATTIIHMVQINNDVQPT